MASQAHVNVAVWGVDKDGVDLTLKREFQIVDMQLKCTYAPIHANDGYAFDLDVATFDKLRDRRRVAAGYLGLFIVPRDVDKWLEEDDREALLVRCTGFYAQIQDLPEARGKATRRIHVPRTQKLDAYGLDWMFRYAEQRLFRRSSGEASA